MKIRLLFIIIMLSLVTIKAQVPEFAPIGAKWWYGQIEMFPPYNIAYWRFEVIKDTVINDLTLRKINKTFVTQVGESTSPFYLYSDSGEIFIYRPDLDILYPYFNFNASLGDTIQTSNGYNGIATNIVDSIVYIEIEGEMLKRYYLSEVGDENYYFAVDGYCNCFTERLGSDGYFFATFGAVDPPTGGPRRCYEDDVLGLYGADDLEDCEYISTGIQEVISSNLSVYPNPAEDKLFVSYNVNSKPQLKLINLAGAEINISEITINENILECDISNIPAGMYFISIISENGIYTTDVIIKP
ncbi:MAG: T9SS type A sorting domain-containing protein [Bacteroidetes bacterium]|nr:T9SS type A sorting domain-containing protein [Bacteroidota bacterium]